MSELLLDQLRAGNNSAWSTFHREHYGRIWSSVQRILNNATVADDVVQETFVKAYREIARFNEKSQIGTWLYRIAINQALDTVRKRRRLDRWLSFFSPVITEDEQPPLPEGSVEPEVRRGLERKDLRKIIETALAELSAEHRAVVQLRLINEMSLSETAQLLRCKPGTVNSRLHYACEHLRRKLQGADIDSPPKGKKKRKERKS